jgi:hypothetical protein
VELGHHLPAEHRSWVWLYLYLVIDVWSRKVVAWVVAEREDPAIAADLVSRACIRERISKGRKQRLVLHADNGNGNASMLPRWRADWKSWACSDPSPGQGCPTTTPSANPCSGQRNTDLTTRVGSLPARKTPAFGWHRLWIGRITGIAKAASSS